MESRPGASVFFGAGLRADARVRADRDRYPVIDQRLQEMEQRSIGRLEGISPAKFNLIQQAAYVRGTEAEQLTDGSLRVNYPPEDTLKKPFPPCIDPDLAGLASALNASIGSAEMRDRCLKKLVLPLGNTSGRQKQIEPLLEQLLRRRIQMIAEEAQKAWPSFYKIRVQSILEEAIEARAGGEGIKSLQHRLRGLNTALRNDREIGQGEDAAAAMRAISAALQYLTGTKEYGLTLVAMHSAHFAADRDHADLNAALSMRDGRCAEDADLLYKKLIELPGLL